MLRAHQQFALPACGRDADSAWEQIKLEAKKCPKCRRLLLVEWLGGGMRTNFWIRTTFGMLIVQIRGQNPAQSISNQILGGFFSVFRGYQNANHQGLSFEMEHSLSFPMRVFTDQFLAGSLRFRSWSSAASLSRIFSSTERLVNHSLAFSSSS